MNDTNQSNPIDAMLQQAGAIKANEISHTPTVQRTDHLFGPTVTPPNASQGVDLSWMGGSPSPAPVDEAKIKAIEAAKAAGLTIVEDSPTTPTNPTNPAGSDVPLVPEVTSKLNIDAIGSAVSSAVTSQFGDELFIEHYKNLSKANKLSFTAPDFSKIQIPEEYEDDPVTLQRLQLTQQAATLDAITQMQVILPDIITSIFEAYSNTTVQETNNLSMRQEVIGEYKDPIHQHTADDFLTRFIKVNPSASVSQAKLAVKSAMDALKPKPASKPTPVNMDWNNPHIG